MSRSRTASIALVGFPAAFALGCIPSARLVSRLLGAGDISQAGDRKPGAANVARTLGWRARRGDPGHRPRQGLGRRPRSPAAPAPGPT